MTPTTAAAPTKARPRGVAPVGGWPPWKRVLALSVGFGATASVALAVVLGVPMIAGWLAGVNLLILVLYGYDKWAASREARFRIPEPTLHLLALAGASPGAVVAQRWFRHKTRKRGFQLLTTLIVLLQAVGLVLWIVI